jgi:uncharacterized protein YwqG
MMTLVIFLVFFSAILFSVFKFLLPKRNAKSDKLEPSRDLSPSLERIKRILEKSAGPISANSEASANRAAGTDGLKEEAQPTDEPATFQSLADDFLSRRDARSAYELGRFELMDDTSEFVGRPPAGLSYVMAFAIGLRRCKNKFPFKLNCPTYEALEPLERHCVDLIFEILFGSTKILDQILDANVTMQQWQTMFVLQQASAEYLEVSAGKDASILSKAYQTGALRKFDKKCNLKSDLSQSKSTLDPHMNACHVVAGVMRRGKPINLSAAEAKAERIAAKTLLPTLLIERARLSDVDSWQNAKSWFGGMPRLGDAAWPVYRNKKAMQFLAQIDLAELSAKTQNTIFPQTGSLAFFLIPFDNDEFKGDAFSVMHVPANRADPITLAPSQPPSPDELFGVNWGNFDEKKNTFSPFYPEWPIHLIPLEPQIQRLNEADVPMATWQEIDEAKKSALKQLGLADKLRTGRDDFPQTSETIYWHTVYFLLERLSDSTVNANLQKVIEGDLESLVERKRLVSSFIVLRDNVKQRVSKKDRWAELIANDVEWLQSVSDQVSQIFKVFLNFQYAHEIKDMNALVLASLRNTTTSITWLCAQYLFAAFVGPNVARELEKIKEASSNGAPGSAKNQEIADAFERVVANLSPWVKDRDPWAEMPAVDIEKLNEIIELMQNRFSSIVTVKYTLRLEELQKNATKAMARNPVGPLSKQPQGAQSALDAMNRQPLKESHQMFGAGMIVQDDAAIDHADWVMLLQLSYDREMLWRFGDVGVFQFWIRPEDLKAHRWNKVEVTFEGH